MPATDYPALVRKASFTNTADRGPDLELELLDGLAQIEPFGVDDWTLKMQGRNLEGWMNVYNLDKDLKPIKSDRASGILSGYFLADEEKLKAEQQKVADQTKVHS